MRAPDPWQITDNRSAEQLYRRYGLPNLIEEYTAFDDVFTRAAPLLMLVFAAGVAFATGPHTVVVGILIFVAVVAGVFAFHAVNQHRLQRPVWSRPNRFGPTLLALWLLVPVLLRLTVRRSGLLAALENLAINIGILAFTVMFATFGLGSMNLWAIRQIRLHTRSVSEVIIKTLPLLLLTVLFFFFGAEAWQLMHHLQTGRFIGGLSAFVVFGSVLLISTILRTAEDLTRFDEWGEIYTLAKETGAVGLEREPDEAPNPSALPRRVRVNIALVLFFSQAVQVFLVFITVAVVLIGIGILVVRPATIVAWIGEQPNYLTEHIGARDRFPDTVTSELIKVSLFVAAFAGVQFAVQIASQGSSAHRCSQRIGALGPPGTRSALDPRSDRCVAPLNPGPLIQLLQCATSYRCRPHAGQANDRCRPGARHRRRHSVGVLGGRAPRAPSATG